MFKTNATINVKLGRINAVRAFKIVQVDADGARLVLRSPAKALVLARLPRDRKYRRGMHLNRRSSKRTGK